MQIVKCDECKKDFAIKVKKKKMSGSVEHNYLICPYCKTITTAYYTNKAIRDMQTKQITLSLNKKFAEKGEIYKEFQDNKVKIKEAMDKLRLDIEK